MMNSKKWLIENVSAGPNIHKLTQAYNNHFCKSGPYRLTTDAMYKRIDVIQQELILYIPWLKSKKLYPNEVENFIDIYIQKHEEQQIYLPILLNGEREPQALVQLHKSLISEIAKILGKSSTLLEEKFQDNTILIDKKFKEHKRNKMHPDTSTTNTLDTTIDPIVEETSITNSTDEIQQKPNPFMDTKPNSSNVDSEQIISSNSTIRKRDVKNILSLLVKLLNTTLTDKRAEELLGLIVSHEANASDSQILKQMIINLNPNISHLSETINKLCKALLYCDDITYHTGKNHMTLTIINSN